MTIINQSSKARVVAPSMALGMLIVFGSWLGCSCKPQQPPKAAIPVTMAVGMLPLTSLAILADHEGLFSRAGVAVDVKKCETGVIAMDAFLTGKTQMAVAGDTPVVFGSLKRRDFRIIADIASWDNDVTIVARKDRGITQPAHLKGKRVATQKTSVAQFFLHMFLLKHGLSEKDVTVCDMPQADFPKAMARGDVEAVSSREPFTSQAVALLGNNAVTFEEPGLYVEYYNLVVSERFLQEQPEATRRVVRALLDAEAFARSQPARARSIVARTISMPEPTLQRVWPRLDLRVRLSQSLLVALEDQVRWIIDNRLTEDAAMPNFLRLIHLETMLAVKPSAVSVIR
ncbi:MAG: NrtA/SsuA/CpmA family ABC transporter substrate-binding protein [Verrucomicrobiia bacterium]